jgi:hypothetical protein
VTTPSPSDAAPSASSLLRSTALALAVAAVLLVTCVLPAEYGKDPTGIGRMLGLTQMGEVKMALAEEAAANAAAEAQADSVIAAAEAVTPAATSVNAGESSSGAAALTPEVAPERERVDTSLLTLQPGKGGEIKLVMTSGSRARYHWSVAGGVVNYDMHGDSTNAPKNWFVSYRKGQRVAVDSGELVAGFRGNHGWFWRNRGTSGVLVRLITSGAYARIETHP